MAKWPWYHTAQYAIGIESRLGKEHFTWYESHGQVQRAWARIKRQAARSFATDHIPRTLTLVVEYQRVAIKDVDRFTVGNMNLALINAMEQQDTDEAVADAREASALRQAKAERSAS